MAKGYHFCDISTKPSKLAGTWGCSKACSVKQIIAKLQGPWFVRKSEQYRDILLPSFSKSRKSKLLPAEFIASHSRKRKEPSSRSRAGRKDRAICNSVKATKASWPLFSGRYRAERKIGAKFLRSVKPGSLYYFNSINTIAAQQNRLSLDFPNPLNIWTSLSCDQTHWPYSKGTVSQRLLQLGSPEWIMPMDPHSPHHRDLPEAVCQWGTAQTASQEQGPSNRNFEDQVPSPEGWVFRQSFQMNLWTRVAGWVWVALFAIVFKWTGGLS